MDLLTIFKTRNGNFIFAFERDGVPRSFGLSPEDLAAFRQECLRLEAPSPVGPIDIEVIEP